MKVLVIGSHGFIGSRLVSNLIEKGHEVFGIDNLEIYSTKHIDFYFKNFDLRKKFFLKKLQYFEKFDCQNYIFLEKIVGTFKPDVVINLGGNSVADKCKENTYDSVRSIYNVNANSRRHYATSREITRQQETARDSKRHHVASRDNKRYKL